MDTISGIGFAASNPFLPQSKAHRGADFQGNTQGTIWRGGAFPASANR
jgi:hypothetical protein